MWQTRKRFDRQFPELQALEDMLEYVDYVTHTGGSNVDIIFKNEMKGMERYKDTIQKVLRWTFKDEYINTVRNKVPYMTEEALESLKKSKNPNDVKDVIKRWNRRVETGGEFMDKIFEERMAELEYKFKAAWRSPPAVVRARPSQRFWFPTRFRKKLAFGEAPKAWDGA